MMHCGGLGLVGEMCLIGRQDRCWADGSVCLARGAVEKSSLSPGTPGNRRETRIFSGLVGSGATRQTEGDFNAPASTSWRGFGGRPPGRSTPPVTMSNAPAAKLAWRVIRSMVRAGRRGDKVLLAPPVGGAARARSSSRPVPTADMKTMCSMPALAATSKGVPHRCTSEGRRPPCSHRRRQPTPTPGLLPKSYGCSTTGRHPSTHTSASSC